MLISDHPNAIKAQILVKRCKVTTVSVNKVVEI